MANPPSNDGDALGTTALQWSDLYLAEGGKIDWDNGDATLTQANNVVTLAGADLTVPSSGLTVGSSVPFSDAAGTLTLQNVDALDATTETTIEAAIDTLANLTSVQGRTVTLADAGADAILGWDDSADAYENLTQAEVLAVVGDSSATAKGVVELATTAETETGTDATRAVTPDGLHDMTSLAGAAWFLDEDSFASDSATKTASQQSIKAYVDAAVLGGGGYTDEQAQDTVGGILTDTATIDFTYSDATPSITADVKDNSITYAKIQDVSATNRILGRITAGSGDTEELTGSNVRTIAGLATSDSPQFTGIELGNASDTTLTRSSAGVLAVEGVTVSLNSTSATHTAGTIELGAASDTTLSRSAAGKLAVEGVDVLTVAGGTLTGNITLGENTSIALDPAGSADGKYSGITVAGTAGTTLAFGDLVYLAAADSRWELADADAASTSGDVMLGMCVLAAASDGDPTTILLHGIIRADAKFPSLTISAQVYVSTTTGAVQVAQPSGTDDVIRVVGRALTADELYFFPSQDFITHT